MKAAELTALLGSRICHDLISPLGAIGNGVELLEMAGVVAGPEMSLISESVGNANARIRFFRLAFGAASADQRIGREEIGAILRGVSAGSRVVFDWTTPSDVSRRDAKLAFLILQCFESAMAWGGRVEIREVSGAWTITGRAQRLKSLAQKWDLLANPGAGSESVSAADVQFVLAPLAAEEADRQIDVSISETEIVVSF